MQQRGVDRRRAILDAAGELFGRQGYRGTGLAAIAADAGITASAVVHHFGSKEGLLQAVLDDYDERSASRLSQYVGQGVAGLIGAMLDNAEHVTHNVHLATLHTTLQAEHLEAADDHPVRRRFLDRNRSLRKAIASIFRTAVADGELASCPDPEAVADEILAFQEGALVLWRLDPAVDLRTLYENYFQRLLTATT